MPYGFTPIKVTAHDHVTNTKVKAPPLSVMFSALITRLCPRRRGYLPTFQQEQLDKMA